MLIREFMTTPMRTKPEDATVRELAQLMREHDVGAVPIERDGAVVGIVTDRDIVVRALATGANPDETPARDVMSKRPVTISRDTDDDEAIQKMREKKVRRLIVIGEENKPVGIVSMGDLSASKTDPRNVGKAMESVCEGC